MQHARDDKGLIHELINLNRQNHKTYIVTVTILSSFPYYG